MVSNLTQLMPKKREHFHFFLNKFSKKVSQKCENVIKFYSIIFACEGKYRYKKLFLEVFGCTD